MKWFGEPWDAPVCNGLCERAEVPVGEECCVCDKKFVASDRGVILPYNGALEDEEDEIPYHLPCFKRVIGL